MLTKPAARIDRVEISSDRVEKHITESQFRFRSIKDGCTVITSCRNPIVYSQQTICLAIRAAVFVLTYVNNNQYQNVRSHMDMMPYRK